MPEETSTLQSFIDSTIVWLQTNGREFALNLLLALIIFFVGKWLAKKLSNLLLGALDKGKVDHTLGLFISRIGYVIMLIVVILAALDKLGIKTTSLVAIIGAAGLAVGLAMQGSLSNFAAGVMIIIFRPFKVGNFIEAGGTKGIVEEISIFHTIMRTPDNLAVIVPNSQINSGVITNYSAKDQRRVDITFGVSYGDDLKVAKETIWKVLNSDERILKDPAPIVGVMTLNESSVDIVCWAWVNATDFLQVKFFLNETVKTELEAAGCSIPFPQRDVHLFTAEKQPAAKTPAA